MTSEFFHPLDDVLNLRFLPAMTSQLPFSSIERELLSLPACLGGMGVIVPSVHFSSSFLSSSLVTAPLVDHLLRKDTSCSLDVYQQMYQCRLDLRVSCHSDLSAQAGFLCDWLSPHLRHAFDAASERGTSWWLTTLPIVEHGFALSKGEFCDSLCLRFGWQPCNLLLPIEKMVPILMMLPGIFWGCNRQCAF